MGVDHGGHHGHLRQLLSMQHGEHGTHGTPVYNDHHHCIANCPENGPEPIFTSEWQVICMTVACMFPIALLFAVLPQAIFGLVLTTSVEQMKRKGVIAEVRRE